MAMSPDIIRTALLQLSVGKDKQKNIEKAIQKIKNIVENDHIELVILPECFTGSYNAADFAKHAEFVPNGEACLAMSKVAKELKIYIIGGSIIEKDSDGKLYNTCTIWSPCGELIGKHRKIHLFDVAMLDNGIMEGIQFKESNTLTPGNAFTIVKIKNRKFGIGICHDIRFNELARIYRNEGCDILVYPAAFCLSHGPIFWELLQRGRAIDNEVYVCMVSIARDINAEYIAYGHTMLVDPWSKVICKATEKEEIIVVDIDFKKVNDVRNQLMLFKQRRTDLYNTFKLSS